MASVPVTGAAQARRRHIGAHPQCTHTSVELYQRIASVPVTGAAQARRGAPRQEEGDAYFSHVLCAVRFLSMYTLFSLGPNTRVISFISGLMRYVYEMMATHERLGSSARTAARRAATCAGAGFSTGTSCRVHLCVVEVGVRTRVRTRTHTRTRPETASPRVYLRVVKNRVGALALAHEERPARAIV